MLNGRTDRGVDSSRWMCLHSADTTVWTFGVLHQQGRCQSGWTRLEKQWCLCSSHRKQRACAFFDDVSNVFSRDAMPDHGDQRIEAVFPGGSKGTGEVARFRQWLVRTPRLTRRSSQPPLPRGQSFGRNASGDHPKRNRRSSEGRARARFLV